MAGSTPLLLAIQVVLALVGLVAFRRCVVPALAEDGHRDVVADVWGPLALALPFVIPAIGVPLAVTGAGWVPVGGPVCAGGFLLGATLLARPASARDTAPARLVAAIAGAAVILLMLGAAHDLTIWSGQIVFAIGAVLLWINSPPAQAGAAAPSRAATRRGLGVAAAVLAGIGQGIAVHLAPPDAKAVAISVLVGFGAVAGLLASSAPDPRGHGRLAGWTAVIGLLFGVGLMSIAHITPQAAAIATGRPVEVRTHVAHSFGACVPEGALLLVAGAALWLAPAAGARGRRVLGAILVAFTTVVAGVRLLALWPAAA